MKAVKIIFNIIITLLIVLIAAVAIALVVPRFFGIQPVAVQTNSMAPDYPQGSMIYVKGLDAKDLEIGDVATFKLYDQEGNIINNLTHRVIEVNQEERTFTTQGDGNNTSDAPVSFDEEVSKLVFSIPYMGVIAEYIDTTPGKIMAGTLILIIIILAFLPDVLRKIDELDEKKKLKE